MTNSHTFQTNKNGASTTGFSMSVISVGAILLLLCFLPTHLGWWYTPWILMLSGLPHLKPNAWSLAVAIVIAILAILVLTAVLAGQLADATKGLAVMLAAGSFLVKAAMFKRTRASI